MKREAGECGMALITVLMLVGVMGALTAATLEVMSRSVALTGNARSSMQARHYARGAALIAAERAAALAEASGDTLTLAGGWADAPFAVPTAGGTITVKLSDGANCFNLNSVVTGEAGRYAVRPLGVSQLTSLAQAVGIGQARSLSLAMSLVDFIDADPFPQGGGGEDEQYDGYRTPNRLLADRSELMAVAGWTAKDYQALQPFLCALPTSEMQVLNVNTLTEAEAPLVTMLAPNQIAAARARNAIAQRPAGGWESRTAFWTSPGMTGVRPPAQALYQVGTNSDLFRGEIEVEEAGFRVAETVWIDTSGDEPEIVRRLWGAPS